MDKSENTDSIFPKGNDAPDEYFTGTAWLNPLVPKDETGSYSISNVAFEPGARTNWHTHPAGQILLATEGKGYYQEKGGPARIISKGDIIMIPSNVVHWHGATKNSRFTHIAVTNITEEGPVKWLEAVTEEDYLRSHNI